MDFGAALSTGRDPGGSSVTPRWQDTEAVMAARMADQLSKPEQKGG